MEDEDCFDEELLLLQREAKRLEKKLEKHREIHRLQLELQQTSISSQSDDEQTLTQSRILQVMTVRMRSPQNQFILDPTPDASQRTELTEIFFPEDFAKMQEDMAQLRDYVRTQLGFEVTSEKPPLANNRNGQDL